MEIELICLDVDGTLIGTDCQVHPKVWAAAERVRQSGVTLAICTGRPAMAQTRELALQLDPKGWHIFQGGASVMALHSGQSLSQALPDVQLQRLKDIQAERGWVLELYSDRDYVCPQPLDGSDTAHLAKAHAELLGLDYAPREYASLDGEVVRAQWVVRSADMEAVMATANDQLNYASATSPSVPDAHFVSVTAAGVDKCSAIRYLAEEHLKCGLERTMMVGDGLNDISALKMVGYPVAMANAEPELKAVAKYSAGHADRGGVTEALQLALQLNNTQ